MGLIDHGKLSEACWTPSLDHHTRNSFCILYLYKSRLRVSTAKHKLHLIQHRTCSTSLEIYMNVCNTEHTSGAVARRQGFRKLFLTVQAHQSFVTDGTFLCHHQCDAVLHAQNQLLPKTCVLGLDMISDVQPSLKKVCGSHRQDTIVEGLFFFFLLYALFYNAQGREGTS